MGIAESYRGPSGNVLQGLQVDLEEELGKLHSLFHEKGVSIAYLFGSYARKEAKATSDIDIAILLDVSENKLYQSYREIMLGVREILGSERFDLFLLNDASPMLRFEIICQGQPIYFCDEGTLNAFEMDAIRRYQDTAYLRAIQNDYLKKRVREWYLGKKVC